MTNSVAAIVVTYNRIELLKKCLHHLESQTYTCDVILVDNASTDGTEEYVRSSTNGERIHYYRLDTNSGGAGGFYYGIKAAAEAGYSYLWLMDDDCQPYPDALEKLMVADRLLGGGEKYGFLSSTVLWLDGKECMMNRQRIVRDFYRQIELLQHGIISINQATFVSLLLPIQTVRQFGLPYKEYVIWGDDIEYTRRIALRGKKRSYLVGQSRVIHAMKQNIGSDISVDDVERLPRYRYSVRNESFTYHKQGISGIGIYYLRCLRSLFRICTRSKDLKLLRIKILFAGMAEGLIFKPEEESITDEIHMD